MAGQGFSEKECAELGFATLVRGMGLAAMPATQRTSAAPRVQPGIAKVNTEPQQRPPKGKGSADRRKAARAGMVTRVVVSGDAVLKPNPERLE